MHDLILFPHIALGISWNTINICAFFCDWIRLFLFSPMILFLRKVYSIWTVCPSTQPPAPGGAFMITVYRAPRQNTHPLVIVVIHRIRHFSQWDTLKRHVCLQEKSRKWSKTMTLYWWSLWQHFSPLEILCHLTDCSRSANPMVLGRTVCLLEFSFEGNPYSSPPCFAKMRVDLSLSF